MSFDYSTSQDQVSVQVAALENTRTYPPNSFEETLINRKWNQIEPLIKWLLTQALEEHPARQSMVDYMEVKKYVHECFDNYGEGPLSPRRIGAMLYDRINHFTSGEVEKITHDFDTIGQLERFERTYNNLVFAAKKIHTLTSRLKHRWAKGLKDIGFEVPDIYDLLYQVIGTLFFDKFGQIQRKEFFRHVWSQPKQRIQMNEYTKNLILDPWRRSRERFPVATDSIRPVFKITRMLDRSRASSDSPSSAANSAQPNINRNFISIRFHQSLSTSHHWATQVGHWRPVDKELSSKFGPQPAPKSRLGPTIFELTAKKGKIVQNPEFGQEFKEDHFGDPQPLGYTLLDDGEIEKLARAILVKNGQDYNPVTNNCQRFCEELEKCILVPQTLESVFEAGRLISSLEDEIICRQTWEYLLTRAYIPINNAGIWPVRDLALTIIDVLAIYMLYLGLRSGGHKLYFLMALNLALSGLCGNVNILRHFQRIFPVTQITAEELFQKAYPERVLSKKPVKIEEISE